MEAVLEADSEADQEAVGEVEVEAEAGAEAEEASITTHLDNLPITQMSITHQKPLSNVSQRSIYQA